MLFWRKYISYLLFPLAIVYFVIIWGRNFLFDTGLLKSKSFTLPIFSIGNLTVGGTGKTPVAEYIINLLSKKYNIAYLSRGYRRKTSGFLLGDASLTPKTMGDEAFQVMTKYPEITVAVDEKRVNGINKILKTKPQTEVIILDDAFQHRYVEPSCNILLTDYSRLFCNDFLMPVGRLREYPTERKRADIIIVTKGPRDLSENEKFKISKDISPLPGQKVFFTTIAYGELCSLSGDRKYKFEQGLSVLLVTGIANPQPLIFYLKDRALHLESIIFSDHYDFTLQDLHNIFRRYEAKHGQHKIIVVTEKDAVKIRDLKNIPLQIEQLIYVLPMRIDFLFNQKEEFDHLIYKYAGKNKG